MLLIRNEGDGKANLSSRQQQDFLAACRVYIDTLTKKEQLISAQPLIREGKMISGAPGAFKERPYNERMEILVGYYHILAKDIDEAVAIAKGNPEFAFVGGAKIEVRPVKMVEESTAYVYPKEK